MLSGQGVRYRGHKHYWYGGTESLRAHRCARVAYLPHRCARELGKKCSLSLEVKMLERQIGFGA